MIRSLVLIKPDGVQRHLVGEIIKRFEDGGFKVVALQMLMADPEVVSKHYQLGNRDYIIHLGHVDTTGWTDEQVEEKYQKSLKTVQSLQRFLCSGPVVKMVLEGGEDCIAAVRSIVGKTDPATSPQGTIRGDLGDDSFEASDREGRSVRNLVHASGDPEEAKREINLWFPDLKI